MAVIISVLFHLGMITFMLPYPVVIVFSSMTHWLGSCMGPGLIPREWRKFVAAICIRKEFFPS